LDTLHRLEFADVNSIHLWFQFRRGGGQLQVHHIPPCILPTQRIRTEPPDLDGSS